MKAGAATLDFSAAVFASPDITGNTKHFTAVVAKPDPADSFGFAIGTLKDGTHIVHHVKVGSLTDAVLEVDDELDMINNEVAAKLSHDELILFLTKSSTLSLSLTRINEHYVDVVLEKKDGSFGVSLGSQDHSHLFVSGVAADGAAVGKLMVGDVIVALNARLIGTYTHSEAIDAIATHDKARFTVIRSDEAKKHVAEQLEGQSAIETVKVSISKESVDHSFGIGIGDTTDGHQVITKVSDAARTTGLLIADEIMEVNGESVLGLTHEEVLAKLSDRTTIDLTLHRQLKYSLDPTRRVTGAIKNLDDGRLLSEVPGQSVQATTPEATANLTVTIVRPNRDSSFGFSFGTLDDSIKLITAVKQDGVAANLLQPNDEIVSVNGKSAMTHNHDDLVAVCEKELSIELQIHRGDGTRTDFEARVIGRRESVGLMTHQPTVETISTTLKRKDDQTSYGFGLGTADDGHAYITEVKDDGIAAKAGLKIDDEIFKVGGVEVTGLDHENIVQKLTSVVSVAIVVKRDIAAEQSEMIDTAHTVLHKFINDRGNIGSAQTKETIIVKIERADENARFGFGIGTLGDGGQVITKVSDEREKEDKIRVADEIVSLNGEPTTKLHHDDLIAALQKNTSIEMAIVRLVVNGQTVKRAHGETVHTNDGSEA
jgi:C-terminal processing protease CtpA/Prc